MRNRNIVLKSFLMVTQIGISMIVPIFLCVFVGKKLDAYFQTSFLTLLLLFLGIMAAIRNVYQLTRKFYQKDKEREDAQLAYLEDMKREREKKKD